MLVLVVNLILMMMEFILIDFDVYIKNHFVIFVFLSHNLSFVLQILFLILIVIMLGQLSLSY